MFMRRRGFIRFLAGAAGWPFLAATQEARLPSVGFMGFAPASGYASRLDGIRAGLREFGLLKEGISLLNFDGRKTPISFGHLRLVANQFALILARNAVYFGIARGETNCPIQACGTELVILLVNCFRTHRMEASMEQSAVKVLGAHDGKAGFLGTIGVRFMIDGDETGRRFSVVKHPMSPHALAAPVHRHTREDEYSYILSGNVGALLGDAVVIGKPGDLIFKPRQQWHTFWNAGAEPARVLEIISPAGFEKFFDELVELGGVAKATSEAFASLCARYELEMDPDSIPKLVERFGLRFPGEPVH